MILLPFGEAKERAKPKNTESNERRSEYTLQANNSKTKFSLSLQRNQREKTMSESIIINDRTDKNSIYRELLPKLKALLEGEYDMIANMANVAAALKEVFNWWWVGFYLVKENELVLGPFQGPVACTRIGFGKGVCGTTWQRKESVLVPDVNQFPGHIACSSASVSEIVVPVFDKNREVIAVLDVDSERFDVLDEKDLKYLEEIAALFTA